MSYPRKLYIKALLFLVVIMVVLFLAIGISAYLSLRDTAKYGILSFFMLGFFFYPLNEKIVDWFYSLTNPKITEKVTDVKNARRGFEGEDLVYSWLEGVVKKENILRNITLPNTKFDIDLMVIGERGIIAIEVKNLSDAVRFEEDEYFYEKDGMKIALSPRDDPRFKFNYHLYLLNKYLETYGFRSVKIKKLLVFTNGKVSWDGSTGMYIVKDRDALINYINKLDIVPELTPQIREKIKTLLDA